MGTSLGYDDNGNLTSYGTDLYAFDYRNRLASSTTSGVGMTYTYDHSMQRVSRTANGITTVYPNSFFTKAGATTTKSIYAGGELIATVESNGVATSTRYVHSDHLGSTNVVTDANGDVVQVLDYYPFGEKRINTGQDVSQREYISQIEDPETSMNYLNNRYLQSDRGQFISQDPVFLALGSPSAEKLAGFSLSTILANPQSLNSYAYAGNNPINKSDPSGLYDAKNGKVEKGDTLGMITKVINGINKTNYSVAQIAKLNSISNPDVIKPGQQIIPNMTFYPDISNSLRSTVQTNAADPKVKSGVGGLVTFGTNVWPKSGPQDYKNQPGQFNSKTHTGFVFDGKAVRSDFPGNVNYGYVGASTEWGSDGLLLNAAATAQVVGNAINGSFSGFSDNPGDAAQIMQGIQLYRGGI